MRYPNKGSLYSSKSRKLEPVDITAHRGNCARLRNFVAEMFLETHKGHIDLYHAIDSYEREPELQERIVQLEYALNDMMKKTAQSSQSVMLARQALNTSDMS